MFVRASHPRKTEILNVRLAPTTLALVDQLAQEQEESRGATLRIVIRAGLAALGVPRK